MSGCEPTEVKETLALCKHSRPLKFGCTKCYFESYYIEEKIESPLSASTVSFVSEQIETFYRLLRPELATMIQQQLYGTSHSNLEKRIEALELHKQRQIDENRAVFRDIQALEQERDKGVERIKRIEERLEGIDKATEWLSEEDGKGVERLKELELFEDRTISHLDQNDERLKDLEESYQGVAAECNFLLEDRNKTAERLIEIDKINKKYPHKCPVCEGSRYEKPEIRTTMQSMSIDGVQVNAGESIYFKAKCLPCEGTGIVWG